MKREFYRPDEIAKILKISKRKVYALMEMGELAFHEFGARGRRVAECDLENYIKSCKGDPLDLKAVQ